jgi:hypothetical protein
MNYPEELRERYNEVMYDERDIIEKFLKDQYDIRYGRQRDSWHLEPSVELHTTNAAIVRVTDIKLDNNKFVVFDVTSDMGHEGFWECTDFAYGELSKVIEALPDAEKIVKENAVYDIKVMINKLLIDHLLIDAPFKYEVNGKFYTLDDVKCVNGTLSLVQALGNDTPASDLPLEVLVNLRDHINIEVLHRSNEYKELMELLSLEDNMRFECQNYGDATFVIDGTDVTFDISSVRRSDNGGLVIYGNDIDADVCDNIELTEKDIKHEYLVGIINEIKRGKYYDIMNTYNGHNEELVRKINDAWKSGKYNQEFGYIIYSIANRDYNECKEKFDCDMDNFLSSIIDDCNEDSIHNVLENVCDDWDLETILSFIRYEE